MPWEHAKVAVRAVLAACAAVLLASPAQAALLAHESFETEALGAFDGTANQTWTLGPATKTIENKNLSYSGGDITVGSGTRVLKIGNLWDYISPVAHFDFATQSGPVYFSFIGQIEANAFFQPWVGTSAYSNHQGSGQVYMDGRGAPNLVGSLCPPGYATLDTADLGNAIPAPVFVVVKLFKSGAAGDNYDRMQVVVNPTSATEPVTWNGDLTKDIGVASLDRFALRYGNNAAAWIDEIRVGTTWVDVVPPALPPLSVAPGTLFGDLTGLGANPGPQVQTVTIRNDSTGAVDLGTPGITGADSGLYQVTSGPTQDPIPAGGTSDIEVTFTPPATGGSFQARLEIPTDRPEVAVVLVALDALVTAPPATLPLHESFETKATGAFAGTADLAWTLGPADETIEDKNLSYSGGDITVNSGTRVLKINNLAAYTSPVASFSFTAQSGPVYFSFLAQIEAGAFFQPSVGSSAYPNHQGSGQVYMDGRSEYGDGDQIVGTLCPPGYAVVDTADLGNAIPAPVFVVVKLSKSGAAGDNYDRMQVVVNPTSATEPGTWAGDIAKDIGVGSLDRFGLRYGNSAAGWIDEIRIGTNWAQVVPGASSAYETWATTTHGLSGGTAAFDFDYENDGLDNGLEWILGGDPTQNDTPAVLPAQSLDATYRLLSFKRVDGAVAQTTLTAEWDVDLAGIWTSVPLSDTTAGDHPYDNGVIVNVVENGTDPDDITIKIPLGNAAGGKLFARIKATMP